MRQPRLSLREQPLPGGQPLAFGIGLLIALIVGTLLLFAAGHEPLTVSYTHLTLPTKRIV